MKAILLILAISLTTLAQDTYKATAYCLRGRTASGELVRDGIIAADPRVLPLGSVVQIGTRTYSVKDTGGAIKGKRVDIWMPSCRQAMQFGKRTVQLTVMSKPTRRKK